MVDFPTTHGFEAARRWGRGYFQVKPRYSAGSPAMVNQETAERVASQEKESYEAALEGIYGEATKSRVEKLGLNGIVEFIAEKKGGWNVFDLITGRTSRREYVKGSQVQVGDVIYRGRDSKGRDLSGTRVSTVQLGSGLVLIDQKNAITLWKTEQVVVERPLNLEV